MAATHFRRDATFCTVRAWVIKQIQRELGLKGIYETISQGNDPNSPNCFMFPETGGRWRAYRFGKGTPEAATWETSLNGWTTCTVNEPATLAKAAVFYGGIASPQKTVEAYAFRDAHAVTSVIGALCGTITIPVFLSSRQLSIRTLDDQSVVVEADHAAGDDVHATIAFDCGWAKNGRSWGTVVRVETATEAANQLPQTDAMVRHVAQHGKQVALFANTTEGWQEQGTDRVRDYLKYRGVEPKLVGYRLGWCSAHPWELTAIPFDEEYPGRRRWNREGSKLLYAPTSSPGATPHWDQILQHIGRGLNDAVDGDPWCQAHGIVDGADYLRRWVAILLRTPRRRLPLLFMYSSPEQNTGKSVFHEGVSQLFDVKGFTFADKALTLSSGFNAELRGSALCVIEETNFAKSETAYTRLKAWITGPSLQIFPKGKDSFVETNYSHWIMTANNPEYLPIEPGDTRVVMWEVTPFEGAEIPKDDLLAALRKEAPQFLHQLFSYDINESAGRHTLPVLLTAEKADRVNRIENIAKYDGLPELPRKLCEAVIAMPKPFSGTATALDEALGDWSDTLTGKNKKSRVTSMGRQLARIVPTLGKQGVSLKIETGRVTTYHIAV